MKNLFIFKKIIFFFSFGKDSIFNLYNSFYKKNFFLFFNYNDKKYKNLNFINFFKKKFFFIKINKFSNNEFFLRKTRFFFKNNNFFMIKNHHFIDKIEFLIFKILKKKKYLNYNNIWIKNKYFLIKPYINFFIKKYIKINDKYNKFIKINRNFIRCLISKFL